MALMAGAAAGPPPAGWLSTSVSLAANLPAAVLALQWTVCCLLAWQRAWWLPASQKQCGRMPSFCWGGWSGSCPLCTSPSATWRQPLCWQVGWGGRWVGLPAACRRRCGGGPSGSRAHSFTAPPSCLLLLISSADVASLMRYCCCGMLLLGLGPPPPRSLGCQVPWVPHPARSPGVPHPAAPMVPRPTGLLLCSSSSCRGPWGAAAEMNRLRVTSDHASRALSLGRRTLESKLLQVGPALPADRGCQAVGCGGEAGRGRTGRWSVSSCRGAACPA